MSAHTPGPWNMGSSDRRVSMVSVHAANRAAKHSTIARMALPVKGGLTYNEIEANARLIAAAPELLEALQDLCDTLGECGMTEKARAAIAKVTGETT